MAEQKDIKIINEIVNDAFWLSFILEIKRNLTDYNQKELLSCFLLVFASIFCDETITAGYGGISDKTTITKKEIADFRDSNLKDCFKISSKTAKSIIAEMGIDFDNYVFDIVLTLENSKIIDINIRNWDYIKPEKETLLEGIVSTPNAWMNILMPDIYSLLIEHLTNVTKKHIGKIAKSKIVKKPYSSSRLFRHTNLGIDDKLYILQRYGLIQLIHYIDCLFDENISISIGENNIKLDFKVFLTKCKATLLEMFWNDNKQNKSITVLNDVFSKNDCTIPKKFFEINRRVRDNLHYGDYHNVTEDEMEFVREYQKIYIDNVTNVFNNHISINFGMPYKISLCLAKIQKWASGNK